MIAMQRASDKPAAMLAADDAQKVYLGVVEFVHNIAVNAWTVRVEATGLVFEGMGESRGDALASAARNIKMIKPSRVPEPKHQKERYRGVPAGDFTHWLDKPRERDT